MTGNLNNKPTNPGQMGFDPTATPFAQPEALPSVSHDQPAGETEPQDTAPIAKQTNIAPTAKLSPDLQNLKESFEATAPGAEVTVEATAAPDRNERRRANGLFAGAVVPPPLR
jgi:hypothetical protein